jgi:thiamine biosynthesis protein ThiI
MPDPESRMLIVHYGELWLRGRNRNLYIRKLKKNIAHQLSGEKFGFEKSYDRILLRLQKDSDAESIKKRISKVFGISAYEFAFRTDPDLKHITKLAERLMKPLKGRRIKVNSHRAHKEFTFTSIDIIKKVCESAEKLGLEPRVQGYDAEIFINVTKDDAFVYTERTKALGGLPVGTSGKAVILLSGGIDSPVAAWYAMKRGLDPVYVHVHGFSDSEEVERSKIPRIIKLLSSHSVEHKAYYIPSHVFQVSAMGSGKYELIMLKSFMLRVAERIAKREGAECIVTGESLGQVASQTSSNIAAEQYGIGVPIHRPLIGFDKIEITNMAKSIGTYEESIKPYKDVCSINSKNPATRTRIEMLRELTKKAKLNSVVSRSIRMAKIVSSH